MAAETLSFPTFSPNERVIEAKPFEVINPLETAWNDISFIPSELKEGTEITPLEVSLMGQGAFGVETYQKLKAQGHHIGVVFAPEGEKDALRKEVLKDQEEGYNVRLYTLTGKKEDLATPEAAEAFNQNSPDIGVFASMTTIAPKEIFDGPKMGTLIYHNSLVPKGRGGSAVETALSNGDTDGGISIILADEGTDTGDIVLQASMEFYKSDTPFSVNADTYKLGVQMMVDSVELAARGKLEQVRVPQDKTTDTQDPFLGKLPVDWTKTAEEVYDFMRGLLNKKPYAVLNPDKPHNIFSIAGDVAWLPDRNYYGVKPGTIVEISEKGMVVTTGDGGAVRVGTLQKSQIYKGKETGTIYETKKPDNIGKRKSAKQLEEEEELQVGQTFVIPQAA